MPSVKYVTHSRTEDEEHSSEKVFDHRRDAISFASQQVADGVEMVFICEVEVPDLPAGTRVRAAVEAVRAGKGHLVGSSSPRLSDEEHDRRITQEIQRLIKNDPEGVLRALREFNANRRKGDPRSGH